MSQAIVTLTVPCVEVAPLTSEQLAEADWGKSSYSADGNCVETAHLAGGMAVRDSKAPEGPTIAFGAEPWQLAMNAIKLNQLSIAKA
ncbi:MAG TPA: DUF397 domain-containing protein [Candidatus Saccharimonadales bacterium]|nr:DUF397 domain-containing protein [Candidatus Saccharimonadales bacterium]